MKRFSVCLFVWLILFLFFVLPVGIAVAFHFFFWAVVFYFLGHYAFFSQCVIFLGDGLLLYNPVTLVSVHHWMMGLWASEAPVMPLQWDAAVLECLSCPGYSWWFQLGKLGMCCIGRDAKCVPGFDDGGCQLTAISPLQLFSCHHNWPHCMSATQELSPQFSEL